MKWTLPDFLIDSNFESEKFDFKWNGNIEDKITTVPPQKVADAVIKLNHKAMMGLATALTELVFWRFHQFYDTNRMDLTDCVAFMEASWAGLIDKNYLLVDISPSEYGDSKAEEVIYSVGSLIRPIAAGYVKGSYFMQQGVANLAAIVRHISPKSCHAQFDDWLIELLDKSAKLFPAKYDLDEIVLKRSTYRKQVFDSSAEPIIPRAFYFTSGFDYQLADITALSQDYLSQLDYEHNPYLNSVQTMLENGFIGSPYKMNEGK